MKKPTAKTHMLCWNPGTASVALVPWPDRERLSRAYSHSTLACFMKVHEMGPAKRAAFVFIEAMHLIVRDKCDPMAVHRALLPLKEYRDALAADYPNSPNKGWL